MNKYFTRGLSLVFVIVFFFISDSLLPTNLANAATTYTITFNANDGTNRESFQRAEKNEKVSLSPIGFSRSGYSFSGWSKNKNAKKGTIRDESEYKMGSRNVTLYAIWSVPAYHTIYFAASNNFMSTEKMCGTMKPQKILEGDTVHLDSNTFTCSGFDFEYWISDFYDANGDLIIYYNNDLFTMGSSDIVLAGNWKPKANTIFFITDDAGFNPSNDYMFPQTIPLGSTANLNLNTYKNSEGKTFLAWVSEDGSRYYEDGDPYTMVLPEGERLTTVWSEEVASTTVNFFPNGGKGKMSSIKFKIKDRPSYLPENTFEKKDYTFDHWETGDGKTFDDETDFWTVLLTELTSTKNNKFIPVIIVYSDSDLVNLANNLEETYDLYAIWSKETYQIFFDANGGEGEMPPSSLIGLNEKINLPTNEFKNMGYDFSGWSVAPGGKVVYKENHLFSSKIPTNIMLYAVWSETPHHFVIFDVNGKLSDGVIGTMEDFPMYENSTDYLPLNLGQITKTGHTFNGWSTKKIGPVMYGDGDPIIMGKKDITLYAVWTANTYRTISFNPNGGNGTMPTQTANIGADVTLPANTFTKSGEVFGGWTGSDGVYYPNNGSFKMGSTDITLSANWHSASYTYRVTNAEVPAVNGYYRWVGPGEEGTGLYSNAPVGQDYKYYTCLGWNPGLGWWGFSACYNWLWYIHTEERDSLDGPWIRGTGPSTIKVERASPGAIAPDSHSYATAFYSWETVLKLIRALMAD